MVRIVKRIVSHPNLIGPLGVRQFNMIVFYHLIEKPLIMVRLNTYCFLSKSCVEGRCLPLGASFLMPSIGTLPCCIKVLALAVFASVTFGLLLLLLLLLGFVVELNLFILSGMPTFLNSSMIWGDFSNSSFIAATAELRALKSLGSHRDTSSDQCYCIP
jgi:hypothetical protein